MITAVSLEEAKQLAAKYETRVERLAGFGWSLPHLEALSDDTGLCVHRGAKLDGDWVREVWIVAPPGAWLAAARRFCGHLFAHGARQLRWQVPLPVDPRHEAVWARYGVRPMSVGKETLLVALDDPKLPRPVSEPWPRRVRLRGGLSLGPSRFGEYPRLAALFQRTNVHEALGYWRGATTEELLRHFIPDDVVQHGLARTQLYTVQRRGQPIGVVIERPRNYDADAVREIDMALEDESLPPRAWAELLATIADLCFRRGATRIVVNVREDFPNMAQIFGAEKVTSWSTENATRTFYTATASQYYASTAAKLYKPRGALHGTLRSH